MPSVVCLFWLWVHMCLLLSLFFGFLWLSRMWDLNPLTRDWTRAPCSGSVELKPLDHWGIPHLCFFFFQFMFQMWWVSFILLWCKTKDPTAVQRPIYYKVMKKWCVGHAGRNGQLEGRVISSEHDTTPSLRSTLIITLRSWTETWHECDSFRACLQALP